MVAVLQKIVARMIATARPMVTVDQTVADHGIVDAVEDVPSQPSHKIVSTSPTLCRLPTRSVVTLPAFRVAAAINRFLQRWPVT